MLIGAHESIAGGMYHAFARGEADGTETLQIFTTYNTRWARRPLDDEEASLYLSEAHRLGWPVMAHAPYLPNLASPDPELAERSTEVVLEELLRCETLGIRYLVLHPGSHMGAGEGRGLTRICRNLGRIHRWAPGLSSRILVENTAGQGTCLGHRVAHLGRILERTHQGDRLGVCIDTCHAFAAGYDLRDGAGYDHLVQRLEHHVGLGSVRAFHLNDSKRELGSRVDRHNHVGQGEIGLEAFRLLVNDPRWQDHPAVVETPSEEDGSSSFSRNIETLKGLREGAG